MTTLNERETTTELTIQQAVHRMQQDFAIKGTVRSEDIIKVLGDPMKSVSVALPTGYSSVSAKWG